MESSQSEEIGSAEASPRREDIMDDTAGLQQLSSGEPSISDATADEIATQNLAETAPVDMFLNTVASSTLLDSSADAEVGATPNAWEQMWAKLDDSQVTLLPEELHTASDEKTEMNASDEKTEMNASRTLSRPGKSGTLAAGAPGRRAQSKPTANRQQTVNRPGSAPTGQSSLSRTQPTQLRVGSDIWNRPKTSDGTPSRPKPASPGHRIAASRVKRPTTFVPFGFTCAKPVFGPRNKWNRSHHLVEREAMSKHPSLRGYMHVHESVEELKVTIHRSTSAHYPQLRARLNEPQLEKGHPLHPLTSSTLSADAQPTTPDMLNRHGHRGSMHDRDGFERGWNNRHHLGHSNLSHLMCQGQREYFSAPSNFDRQPSQQWRRQRDYEVHSGQWRSTDIEKPHPLGPMGVAHMLGPLL